MGKKSWNLLSLVLILLVLITSCDNVSDNKESEDKIGSQADTVLKNKLQEVYYSHLSPTEIIGYFESEGFNFKPELLNPLSNREKYISSVEKLLNIGSYSADVAYQILCKKTSEATNTFKVIKSLCNDVNIESAFDENIKKRIMNNINNTDTLSAISNDVYINTVNNVRESGSHNMYVILSAGSFVETMYLIINSVKNDAQEEKTIKKIIEQKLLFDDLYSMLLFLNTDQNIAVVLTDITELKNAFTAFSVKSEKIQVKKSGNGSLVLSGENKISYSKESYNALKSSIIKLRTKWTVR